MKTYKTLRNRIFYTTMALFSLISLQGQTISKDTPGILVDENILKSYVGRYDYTQGAVLLVTLEDKQLQAQLTGQPEFPIFPSSKDEFYWKVVDARVKFVTDEKGNVTNAIHYQNGTQFEAIKLKDETPVAVNPAVFDKYIGKYDAGEDNTLVITKEGDKLFAQGNDLPVYQLLPASETEYFLREVNARLLFKVSGDKADSILINMAGNQITAIRLKE
jgi:Domain of unknown function (DUF3471)